MSERWMPESGETYYFVTSLGYVGGYNWTNDSTDCLSYKVGNCFKTKKEAEAAAEKVKELLLKLHDNDEKLQDTIQDMVTNTCQAMDKGKKNVAKATCNFGNLPKLTAEVFDRPDCPVWAKYAAVDECGSVRLFSDAPWLGASCWNWSHGEVTQLFGVKFDASDWQNSRIKRSTKAAFDKLLKNCAEQQANKILQKARRHRLSEQYHNAPEKKTLPDWCKVGKWVYAICLESGTGDFFKIREIRTEADIILKVGEGETDWLLFGNHIFPARLRPFNADEMKALVGKVLTSNSRSTPFSFLVVYAEGDGSFIESYRFKYTAKELKDYFTIGNTPCGVLEHFENGEWVE